MAAISVEKISHIKKYIHELKSGRPGDAYGRIAHAPNVDQIVETVIWNIVRYADIDSLKISLRTHNGIEREINMGRFAIQGRRYFVAYANKKIEIREDTRWGIVHAAFDNSTADQIEAIFATL